MSHMVATHKTHHAIYFDHDGFRASGGYIAVVRYGTGALSVDGSCTDLLWTGRYTQPEGWPVYDASLGVWSVAIGPPVNEEGSGVRDMLRGAELPEVDRVNAAEVAENMAKHGGHFEAALARALQYADSGNTRRIREAWPELWNRYLHWR